VLVFATYRLALFERLSSHPDAVLRAVAAKGVKELAYHRDFAGRWFLTLAGGTAESRRRLEAGLAQVWAYRHQLGEDAEAEAVLAHVLATSGVEVPEVRDIAIIGGHTEHLSQLLAEMQSVARAHPMGQW
jgi:ring-1,2-phenylacetyl-CoA epoxidase subunit PaaC